MQTWSAGAGPAGWQCADGRRSLPPELASADPGRRAALQQRKAVIAKLGMDAHWRGAIVVARALRDAGMEVVYVGHTTPDELAAIVTQEDPVLVGLSVLSGNHMTEVPRVLAALGDVIDDLALVVGGTVPEADARSLVEQGVHAVFPTGTPLIAILDRTAVLIDALEARRGD